MRERTRKMLDDISGSVQWGAMYVPEFCLALRNWRDLKATGDPKQEVIGYLQFAGPFIRARDQRQAGQVPPVKCNAGTASNTAYSRAGVDAVQPLPVCPVCRVVHSAHKESLRYIGRLKSAQWAGQVMANGLQIWDGPLEEAAQLLTDWKAALDAAAVLLESGLSPEARALVTPVCWPDESALPVGVLECLELSDRLREELSNDEDEQ
jgi:hypothetical protein